MDKRPLAVIAVFFILGIVLGRFLPKTVGLFHVFIVTLILIVLTLIFSLMGKGSGKASSAATTPGRSFNYRQ